MDPNISLSSAAPLRRIGYGNCGSVWGTLKLHQPDDIDVDIVIKREDACPGRDFMNEVTFQWQAANAASSLPLISVPRCFGLMYPDDERWPELLPLLPAGLERCSRTMLAEKINPVSTQAQLFLVRNYNCAPNRDSLIRVLSYGNSEHCLVRLFLGRRRPFNRPNQLIAGPQVFNLRNFTLFANDIEDLYLPCGIYAKAMAEALAMLHWQIRANGAGVKFVLGARRGAVKTDVDTPLAKHAVWMLDFDLLRPIEATHAGLISIARSFWRNEPYCPRPESTSDLDRKLWDMFADEYRRVGKKVVRAYPREGEDVEHLCAFVDRALEKIVETKGMWTSGGPF